jgi:hypothetical protein
MKTEINRPLFRHFTHFGNFEWDFILKHVL